MSRPRRARSRAADVSDVAWALLTDTPLTPEQEAGWDAFLYQYFPRGHLSGWEGPCLQDLWEQHRDDILEAWMTEHPGTRPSCWWRWDAPRSPAGTYPGCGYDGQLPEPRKRTGGTGAPSHEVLAVVPAFHLGLSVGWSTQERTGLPSEPPTFESQAAYLARHGLLLAGERECLTGADFADEVLEVSLTQTVHESAQLSR